MEYLKDLKEHLDKLSKEVSLMRKIIICQGVDDDKGKSEKAWNDLRDASKEISRMWSGPAAVEEIRNQREKS
jgi:hypothetical protein